MKHLTFLIVNVVALCGLSPLQGQDVLSVHQRYREKVAVEELKLGKFCAKKDDYTRAMKHLQLARRLDPSLRSAGKEVDKIEAKLNDTVALKDRNLETYEKNVAAARIKLSRELSKVASAYASADRRYRAFLLARRALEMNPANKTAEKLTSKLRDNAEKVIQEIDAKIEGDAAAFESETCGIPFHIRFPKSYSRDQQWPLILHVHGNGDTGQNASGYFRTLRQQGYVVCAPTFSHSSIKTGSNPKNDMESLVRIVGYLQDHFGVDPTRTILTGHSAGGTFVYPAIDQHTDVFSGFIAFNAVFNNSGYRKQKPPNPKPILLIEGTEDFNRGITAQANAAITRAEFSDVTFLELEGVSHNELSKASDEISKWLQERFGAAR